MKNNRGISLASVIIMLIVIIIIASVSIIAGNNLMFEAKQQTEEQKLQEVRDAVRRRQQMVSSSGKYFPLGEEYVGIKDPVIGKTSGGDNIVAYGWYLIEKVELEELGVSDSKEGYYVNYELGEVIPVSFDGDLQQKIESYN